MNTYYYFFGDTPQRGICNEGDENVIQYMDSGARFIRNIFSKHRSDEFIYPEQSEIIKGKRDTRFSLAIYTSKQVLESNKDAHAFNNGINYVKRLSSVGTVKEIPWERYGYPPIQENDSGVVVVWADECDFRNIPQKADYYVLIASKELPDPDFLKGLTGEIIIIVQSDVLREHDAQISKYQSWEASARDTVWQYRQNVVLRNSFELASLLIIPFGLEGAVVLDPRVSRHSKYLQWENVLWYHATKMEGDIISEHPGSVPEAFEIFVARVIEDIRNTIPDYSSVIENIKRKIGTNLKLSAAIHICGYNDNKVNLGLIGDNYQDSIYKLSENIFSEFVYKKAIIPDHDDDWCMAKEHPWRQENYEFYQYIIENGDANVNIECPIIKIGNLDLVGREEISAYSAIKSLIQGYIEIPYIGRPLNIAVFGQPGSGKSFGVKEIAKNVLGNETPILEYNLSQYKDVKISVLYSAFRDIQKLINKEKVPLVFFDEFDSNDLAWLQYFLMPMQDGKFIKNGKEQTLGKCIFVFAGGIYSDYRELDDYVSGSNDKETASAAAKKKVPDFISRLKGYVNIKNSINPNTLDTEDQRFVIKRAILLHSIIKRIEKKIAIKINLSDDVLRALLFTTVYKHGARSMESILEMSRISKDKILNITDMPPESQLELHVNAKNFRSLLRSRIHFDELLGRIARFYAYDNNKKWEKILSDEQRPYYKKANETFSILENALRISIGLCGNTGKVYPKHDEHLVVLSNIKKWMIVGYAKRLYEYNVKKSNQNFPKWRKSKSELISSVQDMLKPFDFKVQDCDTKIGLYLWDDDKPKRQNILKTLLKKLRISL